MSLSGAEAVTLGFDDLTPGDNIFNTTYQGTFFTSNSTDVIQVYEDNIFGAGWSSPNNSIIAGSIGMSDIIANFISPVTFVSVTGGDIGGDQDSFRLEIYDSTDTLLDFAETGVFGGNPNSTDGSYGDFFTLSLNSAQAIDYAVFFATSASGAGLSFDDLIYTPGSTPIPEPSTFLLLGGGLAGLAFAVRRRRKE